MPEVPHGTTVAAVRFADGVAMGGDRRATEGMNIAQRDIEKVFPADDFSAVAIAGAAGPAIEMVRLFQTELEHYEKIEGFPLSLEGKANKLGQMVGATFPWPCRAWSCCPCSAATTPAGRPAASSATTSPAAAGRTPTTTPPARAARTPAAASRSAGGPTWTAKAPSTVLVEALYDAADEDAATGGPDLVRGIFPVVATVTAEGYRRVPDDELRKAAERLVAARAQGEG